MAGARGPSRLAAITVRVERQGAVTTVVLDRAAVRNALPDEDCVLLVLRVDKRLEWKELARVILR